MTGLGDGTSKGSKGWLRDDFLVAQLVKNLPAMRETWVQSLGWEDPPQKGIATHCRYTGLENSLDCIVHGVTKSWTRLSNFHFQFSFHIANMAYVNTTCFLYQQISNKGSLSFFFFFQSNDAQGSPT